MNGNYKRFYGLTVIALTTLIVSLASSSHADESTKSAMHLKSSKYIQEFLNQHCTGCHREKKQKGKVRLDDFEALGEQARDEILNKVEEQIFLEQMPPEDDEQPTKKELEQFLVNLNGQYKSMNVNSKFRERLKTPAYGNYLNHEKLFSGKYKHLKGYTPDRHWLISEYIFDAKINKLVSDKPERVIGGSQPLIIVTNPFLLPDQTGVRYYDNTIINGGHLTTMRNNAKAIADYIIGDNTSSKITPVYDLLKDRLFHKNLLLKREEALKKNIAEIVQAIYQEKNDSLLPQFVRLKIAPPGPVIPKKKGKKSKKPKWHAAQPGKEESSSIFAAIRKYKKPGLTDEQVIEKCEEEWFFYGTNELRLRKRIVFMRGYMPTILKYMAKGKKGRTTQLSDDEMRIVKAAIIKHRTKGDTYLNIIEKCMSEWRQSNSTQKAPSKQEISTLLKYLYTRVFERPPSGVELMKFTEIAMVYFRDLDRLSAIRQLTETLILETEFVYRSEFGQGKADVHGRRMMSSRDASYALAYALTDNGPDKELLKAVSTGRLSTPGDYTREVKRMLANRRLSYKIESKERKSTGVTKTPIRKLRFFREFFGYPGFLSIFKDDKRFGANYERTSLRLLDECDKLVDHIINNDKNVIEELLTTDKFYVFHSGDNKQMKKASDDVKNNYEYFNSRNWQKFTEKDLVKHKDFLKETEFIKFKGSYSLRSFREKMEGLSIRFSNSNTPNPYGNRFAENESARGSLGSPTVAKFFNIKFANWDYQTTQPASRPNRKGILTHPAWLIAHAHNTETDPVIRGKFIREKLLAGTVPDVPINVEAVVPEDHHRTLRQRLVEVTEKPECWNCHKHMNPLGYAFEMYDDFGRYRQKESIEHPENLIKKIADKGVSDSRDIYKSLPVNAKGHLKGTGNAQLDGEVKDAIDLIERLGKSEKVRQSVIRHAFRYFMGRNEMLSDSKTLMDADEAYVKNGGSFDALIVSLLTSDSFIYRKEVKE